MTKKFFEPTEKKIAFKISELVALVAIDDDGTEGVIGTMMPDGHYMPLIAADEDRLSYIYPLGEQVAKRANMPFRVLRFSTREDITDQTKEKYGK